MLCFALITFMTQFIFPAGHFSDDQDGYNSFDNPSQAAKRADFFWLTANPVHTKEPAKNNSVEPWKQEIDWNNPDKLVDQFSILKISALFKAITFAEPDLAIKLLEHGANPNTTESGISALEKLLLVPSEIQFQRLKPVMVKLLQKGANANHQVAGPWRQTMLDLAIQENRDLETLQMLLTHKANPNQSITYKITPLMAVASKYVAANTDVKIKNDLTAKAKLLMRYGANAYAQDSSRDSVEKIAPKLIAEIDSDFNQEKLANHALQYLIDQNMAESNCFPLDMKVMISCMLRHKL